MNVVFLADILENFRDGRRQIPPRHIQDALALSYVLRPYIHHATGMSSTLFPFDQSEKLRSLCYHTCLGKDALGDTYEEWLRIQVMDPPDNLIEYFKVNLKNDLIVGYHLPSLFRQALDLAEVKWLNLECTSPGFLDDLVFSLSSSNNQITEFLKSYSLAKEYVEFAAAKLQAFYVPKHLDTEYWLYPNSLLIVAPTCLNYPHINKFGKQITLLDFKNKIIEISKKHRQTYVFYQYANDFTKKEHDFLRNELKAVFFEFPKFVRKMDAYMLLTHPAIDHIAGLDCPLIADAKYFGKKVSILNAKKVNSIPLNFNWISINFWKNIFQIINNDHVLNSDNNLDLSRVLNEFDTKCNLRSLLQGGDKFFDDTNSSKTSHEFWLIHNGLEQAQLASDLLADKLHESYMGDLPKEHIKKNKFPYAIVVAGDKNILIQGIVTLKSFGLQLENPNLYYICPKKDCSQKNEDLLKTYGITLIPSDAHLTFDTRFRGTPSAAYLQLAVPEILSKLGYSYSLSLQPDMLCLRPFNTDFIFDQTQFIAAPANNFHRLSNSLRVSTSGLPYYPEWNGLDETGFIPSVLFYNHEGLAKINFTEKTKSYFEEFGASNLPMNEESLLHIFHFRHPNFCLVLDEKYSYRPSTHSLLQPIALHFDVNVKPWKPRPYWGWKARVGIAFQIWHKAAQKILGKKQYQIFIDSLPHKNLLYGVQSLNLKFPYISS